MIDKTAETEADPGYLLTVDDLEAWEPGNGADPRAAPGCCCAPAGAPAPRTRPGFSTSARTGRVTPGPDVEASRWLADRARRSRASAIETVGIDAGAAGGFDPPFPLHNFLLGAGRLGLTQLANLERLPATGALLVVSPLRLVGGTGSPSRVYAFVPARLSPAPPSSTPPTHSPPSTTASSPRRRD